MDFHQDIIKEISIRPLNDSDDLIELTKLLNLAYKKHADNGFKFLASHQDEETTKRRLEKYQGYVALMNSKIIATICYHPPGSTRGHRWYENDGVASFGQFAVDPSLQKLGIGKQLIGLVEKLAESDNAKEITIDTAEGATDLINFYTKKGYRFIDYAQWDTTNYRSVILSKKINGL